MKSRYGKIDDANAGVDTEKLYVVDSNMKQTVVEMVGAKKVNEKQSKLDELKEVVLREMMVYGIGPHGPDLKIAAPNIQDLDISRCLLPSWESISRISDCIPNLRNLNVSENKLKCPDNPEEFVSSFKNIKVLYLNRMDYNWQEVLQCSKMFPSLEQLHVCFNCINELVEPNGQLSNLQLLNLESNSINSWSQVIKLGHLPQLETLILNSIGIDDVFFPDAKYNENTKLFQNLKSLSVNSNKITEWKSINEMNKLQHLEKLKIKNNPIMQSFTVETVRQLFIAKISSLKECNGTKLLREERRMAEFDYLKRFGPIWLMSGGNQDPSKNNPSEDFMCQHPRFQELIKIHGAPENSEMEQKKKTLKDSLISVKIHSPSLPDKEPLQKKLPATMTVQKLKTLVQRLYKLEGVYSIDLYYESAKMKGPEIEMENDLRDLSFYSVESGDTIQVKWS